MLAIEQLSEAPVQSTTGRPPDQLGQKDFLKLLVAQLKNQDPSNPVDNSEFLGQIAQFSTVSGIEELNGAFGVLSGSLFTGQAMQASSLIGKQVLTGSDSAVLAPGGVVEGAVELSEASLGARVNIWDEAGNLVDTFSLPASEAGLQRFARDGAGEDDKQLPPGNYFLTAEAISDGDVVAAPVRTYKTVDSISVDRANAGIDLHLAGGQRLRLSQVTEFK